MTATALFLPIQEAITAETAKWGLRCAIGAGIGGALIGGIGAGPAAMAGGKAGAVVGAAKEGFRVESASALMDYEDAGMDSDVAWWAATAYGVIASFIEGGTELFAGLPILLGASPSQSLAVPAKQAAKLTVKKAIFDFAKNLGKMKVGESVEEGLQQFAQNAVGEAGKALSNMNPDWSIENLGEGVIDSVVQTLWSAIGAEHPTIRLGVDLADVRATRAAEQRIALRDQILAGIQGGEQAILEQLDGFSQESQLAKLDPLLYEDALRHLAQGSPIKTVYIPAQGITDAYADNTAKLNETLDALGVAKEDYQLALESGGDLLVPVEKYAATVAANAEFVARIAGHRRLTEDGFTVNELQDWQAAQRDEMQRLMEAAQSEEMAATQTERESQEIFWAMRQQLEAAGQPQDVARANAAQMAAFFATMSSRSGQYSPRQLWDMYAPDVRQGENGKVIEAGEALTPVERRVASGDAGQVEAGTLFSVDEGGNAVAPGEDAQQSRLDAEAALQRDVAAWEKTVDDFLAGPFPSRKPVEMLHQTPLVLTLLGADKDLKITTSYSVLKKVLVDKHNLPEIAVKQVPASMTSPIMIFDSGTIGGDFVMMLDIKDENGATVVVPISLELKSGRGEYEVNIVTSMYAQKDTNTGKPRNNWFVSQIQEGKLRYQNKQKSRSWLRASGLQLPGGLTKNGKNRILTETDLVKLQDQYPTYYANGAANTPRGSIALGTPSGRPLVTLFEQADASTFLHESGHLYSNLCEAIWQNWTVM